jgi:hypothetical protein
MQYPWIAAVLNFFLMGAGPLYNGRRRALGAALSLGAIALTYVELNLQTAAPSLFPVMFATVFLMNTFFAVDGYQEARALSTGTACRGPRRAPARHCRLNLAKRMPAEPA